MSDQVVRTGWDRYAQTCLPKGADPIQARETRRAFYQGAAYLFGALTRIKEEPEIEVTLASVERELWQFVCDMRAERV